MTRKTRERRQLSPPLSPRNDRPKPGRNRAETGPVLGRYWADSGSVFRGAGGRSACFPAHGDLPRTGDPALEDPGETLSRTTCLDVSRTKHLECLDRSAVFQCMGTGD